MTEKDDEMLAAYQAGLSWSAERIRQMGGDPAKPTREQAETVARELLDRAMLIKSLVDPDSPTPTAEEVIRDHRRLQRLKKRSDQ